MKYTSLTAFIYAALVAVGGIIGFAVAGSVPSLIAGLVSASLVALFAFLMHKDNQIGAIGTPAITFLLGCFFLYRYVITEKFMPAGLMVILSAVVLLILFKGLKEQRAA